MNETILIRDAKLADAKVIADFNVRLAWESEGKQLDREIIDRGVQLALGKPEMCRYFLAEVDGRVVGQTMITYEWSDWRAGVFWWIQSVYVVAESRRQGVFSSLLGHLRELARSNPEVCGLRLYVEEHNAVALGTYRRLGFMASGHVLYELDWSVNRNAGHHP